MPELNPATPEQVLAQWKFYCMEMCRVKRNALLAETDYINMPDVTVSDEYKSAMFVYRQELRDFPETFSALFDAMTEDERDGITDLSMPWPTKPE